MRRLLALCLVAATAGPARADDASLVDQACAAVAPAATRVQDLQALAAQISQGQADKGEAGLEPSCQGWRQVLRDNPGDALLLVDWQAKVAAALVWLGRSAQAEPLFDASYRAYAAAGPAQLANGGQVAAMLALLANQRAQYGLALQWSQRAIDALDAVPANAKVSARDRLRIRLSHGALLARQRQFDAAAATLQTALAEALAQPDTLAEEAAAALNGLANLATRQSRLDDALAYTDRELALRQQQLQRDPVNIVVAMQNRGVVLMNLARFDEAEAVLQAALQQAQQAQAAGAVDIGGHQASVRESLSGLLRARGRPAAALAMANDAVAALAGRPEAAGPRGARPLRRVAEAQLALGDLGPGVATYRQALALLATSTVPPDADTAYALRMGYAATMLELGDLQEADVTVQAIVADTRPRSPEEQSRTQVLLATLAQRRGDMAAAAAAWQAADRALAGVVPPEHPARRLHQAQACELDATLCAAAQDAAPQGTLVDNVTPDTAALLQMSQARRARAAGRAADAEAAARQAVRAALASGQPRLQWQALALWADLLADHPPGSVQRTQAIFVGKLALTQLQQQRQRLLPLGAVADARYLADKTPLYRRVADWLLQAGRLPEALEVVRLLKVQEQADFNARAASDGMAGAALGLTGAEQLALQRYESALQRDSADAAELRALSERAAAQRITPAERERLVQLQRDAARQRGARNAGLDAVLAGLPPPAATPARGAQAAALPLRQRPPAGQLHVVALAGEQRLSLLLIGADPRRPPQLLQLDLPAATLARQVVALREALAQPGQQRGVQDLAQAMYASLGRPIADAARAQGARQIVVWLDGPLRYLPLQLLHDGSRHLAERYRWVVDGGVAAPLLRPASVAGRAGYKAPHIDAYGVTQALQGLPALPGVADELCGIVDGPVLGLDGGSNRCATSAAGDAAGAQGALGKGPLPGQGRLNGHFTAAALARDAAAAAPGGLLHIGTHFVLRPGSVAKSWLLLGDGTRLPLGGMRSLAIGAPRLVTLSACETGVIDGHSGDGREVDGLAAALLDNGAAQVLASLWRVDDQATARFMQRFYAAYARQRGDAAAALQIAQRQALRDGVPARDWAAFVLLAQGTGR